MRKRWPAAGHQCHAVSHHPQVRQCLQCTRCSRIMCAWGLALPGQCDLCCSLTASMWASGDPPHLALPARRNGPPLPCERCHRCGWTCRRDVGRPHQPAVWEAGRPCHSQVRHGQQPRRPSCRSPHCHQRRQAGRNHGRHQPSLRAPAVWPCGTRAHHRRRRRADGWRNSSASCRMLRTQPLFSRPSTTSGLRPGRTRSGARPSELCRALLAGSQRR